MVHKKAPSHFSFMCDSLADNTETKGEMAEEGLLEPLVIIETGDIETSGSSSVAFEKSCDGDPTLKEEEVHMVDKNDDTRGTTLCSEQQKTKSQAREEEWGEKRAEENKNRSGEGNKCASQTHEKVHESLGNDEKVARNQLQVDTECSTSCEQPVERTKSPEEDAKQVCGPDFCSDPDIS